MAKLKFGDFLYATMSCQRKQILAGKCNKLSQNCQKLKLFSRSLIPMYLSTSFYFMKGKGSSNLDFVFESSTLKSNSMIIIAITSTMYKGRYDIYRNIQSDVLYLVQNVLKISNNFSMHYIALHSKGGCSVECSKLKKKRKFISFWSAIKWHSHDSTLDKE